MPRSTQLLPTEERTWSVEEVGEVIRTASALVQAPTGEPPVVRDRLRWGELVEVARELGIPVDVLRRALPEAEARRRRAAKRTRRKMRFWRHLGSYGVVVGGLTALDLAMGPGWFVHLPATAWGILVGLHGMRLFVTGKDGPLHDAVYRRELEAETRSGR